MKALGAALVAAVILYVADFEYNNGRFSQVIAQAVTSVIPR